MLEEKSVDKGMTIISMSSFEVAFASIRKLRRNKIYFFSKLSHVHVCTFNAWRVNLLEYKNKND